ncbi:glutamate ligase domain-containing protein, partial [Pseudomonas sp. K5]|uniref:glutamate ligase domain-containing protein n=1 Tax=Pseudomonas sp. K5 TaxID=1156313 RepID=UPI001D0297DC
GWHIRGEWVYRGGQQVFDTANTPLPGRHNRGNLCAVLAAIEALGLDAVALAPAVQEFQPLPNRLQTIGSRDGLRFVNDSISTTPHASLAALECFAGQRIALLVGGHDRGLDWHDFVDHMAHDVPPVEIVTMGANGPRIHALLQPLADAGRFGLHAAGDLDEAVRLARAALGGQGGVVLMSPGAPSYGVYRDYVARGRHFAELAGFDPDQITAIPGIGIA